MKTGGQKSNHMWGNTIITSGKILDPNHFTKKGRKCWLYDLFYAMINPKFKNQTIINQSCLNNYIPSRSDDDDPEVNQVWNQIS